MSFRVKLQPHAQDDLDTLLGRLKNKSPQGAASWYAAWTDARKRLAEQADIYGVAPEDADHDIHIQQILFKTRHGRYYRAIYTITGDVVHVMHIRGHGSDLLEPDELNPPNQ